MYERILVPLDGSETAECILPHVREAAKRYEVEEVVLLRVVEPVPLWDAQWVDTTALERVEQETARQYLADVGSRLRTEGLNVREEVLVDHNAAGSIVDFSRGNAIDLITLATHGRTGISRWVIGSVADRVLRSSRLPVLMVTPPGYRAET
ncbi:MAG: universal stress protein [Dehalococcoidia bacterium]